ncbi:hypothetical protein [Desulfovibrio sp. TomC]|uniref:hypothetical protein n=1 Tax=Desulfovibrio sp. TomC TaxID=1562888 RepID=UPI0005BAA890|nr:hypothetical protein [Desulfovibrio sp. TomC]
MALPAPQSPADKAAMRQRRRWLARRRCLRALRRTLTFIVLVTPFCYFGLILCCGMPAGMGGAIRAQIYFYEWWMFFQNGYVFTKYIWHAPRFAALPLLVNIAFIVAYPPGNPWQTNYGLYFEQFYKDRMEVIRLVENGVLVGFDEPHGVVLLPPAFAHTAFPTGRVGYSRKGTRYRIYFPAQWDPLTQNGFEYDTDYHKEAAQSQNPVYALDHTASSWYFVDD